MSKADKIQEEIREAYNKYYDSAEELVRVAVATGEITEEEAADIVIF